MAAALAATPCQAAPFLFTLEAAPFTAWDLALDSSGDVTSLVVADADGDGLESFVLDLDPGGTHGPVHIMSGPSTCLHVWIIVTLTTGPPSVPFLRSVAGDSLILDWTGAPGDELALGEHVVAVAGVVSGLDGVVRENPGIPTAQDLLATDLDTLTPYDGEAVVEGRLTVSALPEPGSGGLLLLALPAALGATRGRKG